LSTNSNDLTLRLGFDIDKFAKDLGKAHAGVSTFAKDIKSLGSMIGVAFGVQQVGSFILHVSRLSGEAEGVTKAFNKLQDSAKLMRELKTATGNTVSELELMKRSVMASNFDISLKALPQLLEFATLRARQTGQSVNYLVDSIVTGIGRKSKLILDNLGISAVQLTEALGGASAASSSIGEVAEAVGRIASENLKKMGSLTDDAAVKADRLAASWENVKVSIGTLANNAGVAKSLELLDGFIKRWNIILQGKSGDINDLRDLKMVLELFNKSNNGTGMFRPEAEDQINRIKEAAKRLGVEIKVLTDHTTLATKIFITKNPVTWIQGTEGEKVIRNVKTLTEQIKNLEEEISLSDKPSEIRRWQKEIESLQKEIDKLLGKVEKAKVKLHRPLELIDKDVWASDDKGTKKKDPLTPIDFEVWSEGARKSTEAAFEKMMEMRNLAAKIGDDFGEAFGSVISGAQTFAQAMAEMAVSVISSIERIVLANMIASESKYGLKGIIAAAIGFGVVKSIFKTIGREKTDTSGVTSGSRFEKGNWNMQGMNLVAQVSGRDLKFILKNQDTFDSRAKTT